MNLPSEPCTASRSAIAPGARHALRPIPYMGVIYVVAEAAKLGYHGDHPDWCNLGQGQPEVGPLPGAPERVSQMLIRPEDHAYGPVEGLPELRDAVAALYNHCFRRGKSSQYTRDNVTIAAGGRLALSRAVAALAPVNLGYFVPDYTAYEDMLTNFDLAASVPIQLAPETGFSVDMEQLEQQVVAKGLRALLTSNPCNPTGRVMQAADLAELVRISRTHDCTLLLDEFYSHYIWNGAAPISAAACVDDVDADPVLIFDGLTKNFRYPGWRVGWVVGPAPMVNSITCSGSFLDGGPPRFLQRAVIDVIEPRRAEQETEAMRATFKVKRDLMVRRLKEMGIGLDREPDGTFYVFGSVAGLRPPLNDGFAFFRRALEYKVLTVPGEFFAVNPGNRHPVSSVCSSFVRFSFGPPLATIEKGLDRLEKMIVKDS
jgi:N-succinyldiaminopimelate aminotransferase